MPSSMAPESMSETGPVQRVLAMPELLGMIFTWISRDDRVFQDGKDYTLPTREAGRDEDGHDENDSKEDVPQYGKWGVLVRCGCVNQLWWMEAMSLIWRSTDRPNSFLSNLARILAMLKPTRLNIYANFIEHGTIYGFRASLAHDFGEHLRLITFPRLKSLGICFPPHIPKPHILKINAPCLKELKLDPPYADKPTSSDGCDPLEWDMIFDQIPVRSEIVLLRVAITGDIFLTISDDLQKLWPSLESVNIEDPALVGPGALERFAAKLPNLKGGVQGYAKTEPGSDE